MIICISHCKKKKFSINDFNKCYQIRSFLWLWSHLLKKSIIENFICYAVITPGWTYYLPGCIWGCYETVYWYLNILKKNLMLKRQKQPFTVVLKKRCSENIRQIYKRTSMPKCDFSKVFALYWNHTSAWGFYCKFATCS